jgi:hypothetical protein
MTTATTCISILQRSDRALLTALIIGTIAMTPTAAHAEETPAKEPLAEAYGGSIFKSEARGVSAGFHRWLGRVGTHYADCVGATLLVAVDDPWRDNHFYFGAVFATAVGEYGDPNSADLFAAAASTTDYIDQGRSVGGTTALPPLPYSYSTIAGRAGYRLRTKSWASAEAYVDLGYGLVGTSDAAQMHGFTAAGANVVVKVFPSLSWTLGMQYRVDIPGGDRLAGFEELSALAIYNSMELVKF